MAGQCESTRTLLLVDDEANIINALKRTFRRDGYTLLTANSGKEGLEILAQQDVHVILSDQRMPHMSGVEFLRQVKVMYPKTLRISLSGYTDLETVTSAINEGAIYKFLTKPWEDEQLRENIRKAFEYYEMEQENLRLTRDLQAANDELSRLNQNLEMKVLEKTREVTLNVHMLKISQEILEHLPVAVVGIDEQGMIAASNRRAEALFRPSIGAGLLGADVSQILPETVLQTIMLSDADEFDGGILQLPDGVTLHLKVSPMGISSSSKGKIIVLSTDHQV